MTKNDVTILKKIIYIIDQSLPFAKGSKAESVHNDEEENYYKSLILKCMANTDLKRAKITPEHKINIILPDSYETFEMFAAHIAEEMHSLQSDNFSIAAGDGIFLYTEVCDDYYIFFIKLNYNKRFMHQVEEDGNIKLIENRIILPGSSQRFEEFFAINLNTKEAYLSNISYQINGEMVNYLSEHILELTTDLSEKEKVDIIDEAAVKTIEEYYPDDHKVVMEYKNTLAACAQEKGTLEIKDIAEVVFLENEAAAASFKEAVEECGFTEEKVYLSPKTERKLCKKQKIIADNGIELLIPVEYLNKSEYIEYVQDPDGGLTLIIKDVGNITNK